MRVRFFFVNIFLLLLVIIARSEDLVFKELILHSDQNIVLTLHYATKANIAEPNWLKISISNQSDKIIQINEVSYSINKEINSQNEEPYIDHGALGQGNHYDLFHYYYEYPNASDYRDKLFLPTDSSIISWKYLTNYASVLLDSRISDSSEICALFNIKVGYTIQNRQRSIESGNKQFCFFWTHSSNVSNSKLVERIREVILNTHYRWVNSYVTKTLIVIPEVVTAITDGELIEGVMLRRNVMSADESILLLQELSKRHAIPNQQLTAYFEDKLRKSDSHISTELLYYWDNNLLDELITSKVELHDIVRILEVNSKYWFPDTTYSLSIYKFLTDELNFTTTADFDSNNIIEWTKKIKIIAVSRYPKIIDYLKLFLDNELEFTVDDWSKYRYYGMLPKDAKPDKIKMRICDSAFIALLRALNQIDFSINERIGTRNYSLNIKKDVLDQGTVNKIQNSPVAFDITLNLYEKEIQLTPEWKERIRTK